MRLRSNSDRRVKHTAEALKTCQTHQRVDILNTDHKDVAFTVSSPQKSVLRIKLLSTMIWKCQICTTNRPDVTTLLLQRWCER